LNVLLAKTEEVKLFNDTTVEYNEFISSIVDEVNSLTDELNEYKLCVACNNAFVLNLTSDADTLNDDADITKLPL
jgi:hypothetical protein